MIPEGWTIRVLGYLPVDDPLEARLRRVSAVLDKLPDAAFAVDAQARTVTVDCTQAKELLCDPRQVLRPLRITERIVVKPPWDAFEARPGDVVLEIDPGIAFGSGLHESTGLCLRALDRHVVGVETAVDFGTGSGILAIAAAKLGVARLIAIEAHAESAEIARANVRRNHLQEKVQVHCADSLAPVSAPVDLVMANITAETITAHLAEMASRVKAGGVLLLSGMTRGSFASVEEALPGAACAPVERLMDGNWVAVVATKLHGTGGRVSDGRTA